VITKGMAVRHVGNILNKLGLHSRAQVAAWGVERGRSYAHRSAHSGRHIRANATSIVNPSSRAA
jgi:hypothetical protein